MNQDTNKLPNKAGIYMITILIDGVEHVYIGQSSNMRSRQRKHMSDCRVRPKDVAIYPLFKDNKVDFVLLELMENSTIGEREERESVYISKYRDMSCVVYNKTDKGNGKKERKPVDVYCVFSHKFIDTHESVMDACKIYGVRQQYICNCCHGEQAYANSYIFRWRGDDLNKFILKKHRGDITAKEVKIIDTISGETLLFESKREASRHFGVGHSTFSHPLSTGSLWKGRYKVEMIS